MILKKLIKKELIKHGIFHGFKFNNQFQILKDNYKIRFLIDGVIIINNGHILTCDMLVNDDVKKGLLNVSIYYKTELHIIDYFDWHRNDITIEQKINRCVWSTNNQINNKKLN